MINVKELINEKKKIESDVQFIVQVELCDNESFRFFMFSTSMDKLEQKIISCGIICKNKKTSKTKKYQKLKELVNAGDDLLSYELLQETALEYICCFSEMTDLYVNNHQGSLRLAINIYDEYESLTEIEEVDNEIFRELLSCLIDES